MTDGEYKSIRLEEVYKCRNCGERFSQELIKVFVAVDVAEYLNEARWGLDTKKRFNAVSFHQCVEQHSGDEGVYGLGDLLCVMARRDD